jgi:hypothetical protein
MAPSIPTHRPLMTATRVSMSIAIAASASSVYLAFGSAWAVTGLPIQDNTTAAICPVASSGQGAVSAQASARDEQASIQ